MKCYKNLTLLNCIDRKTREQKSEEYYNRVCDLYYMFGDTCRIIFDKEYILTSWGMDVPEYYENESEKLMILTTMNSEYYFRVYFKD